MKKLLLTVSILSLNVMVLMAQNVKRTQPLSANEIAQIQTDKMVFLYSLNETQRASVYEINLDVAIDLKLLPDTNLKFPDSDLTETTLQDRSDILRNQRIQISKILTAVQKSKFQSDNDRYDKKRLGDTKN